MVLKADVLIVDVIFEGSHSPARVLCRHMNWEEGGYGCPFCCEAAQGKNEARLAIIARKPA